METIDGEELQQPLRGGAMYINYCDKCGFRIPELSPSPTNHIRRYCHTCCCPALADSALPPQLCNAAHIDRRRRSTPSGNIVLKSAKPRRAPIKSRPWTQIAFRKVTVALTSRSQALYKIVRNAIAMASN